MSKAQDAALAEYIKDVRLLNGNGVTIKDLTYEKLAVLFPNIKAEMLIKVLMYFFKRGSAVNLSTEGVFSNEQGTLSIIPYKRFETRGAYVWTDARDKNMSVYYDYDHLVIESFYSYEWHFKLENRTTAKVVWDEVKTPADDAKVIVKFPNTTVKVVLKNVTTMNNELAKAIVSDIYECPGTKGTFDWAMNLFKKLHSYAAVESYFHVSTEGLVDFHCKYINRKLVNSYGKFEKFSIGYDVENGSFGVSDNNGNRIRHNKDLGKNKMEYLGDETAAGEKISELREALESFLEKYGKIPF